MADTDSESNATLMSALKLSERAQFVEAGLALLITVLFTTAPVLFDMLYYVCVVVVGKYPPSLLAYIYGNDFRHGELGIYSTALLAPIFYYFSVSEGPTSGQRLVLNRDHHCLRRIRIRVCRCPRKSAVE